MIFKNEKRCRSCASENLVDIIDFGQVPLADHLLKQDELDVGDIIVPMTLVYCNTCSLLQLKETVEPDILFNADYPYFSSVSAQLVAHFKASALKLIETLNLDENSLVIEAASNDGYMLKNFTEKGIRVVGIEPSHAPAARARQQNIETRDAFFTQDYAQQLREEFPEGANLFIGNNVLAHVKNLNGFVNGIREILNVNGTAVIEVPYLYDLIRYREFDTIYHQHLCYFSVTSLHELFNRHQLNLNDVIPVNIHGGSIRLFINKYPNQQPAVQSMIDHEAQIGMTSHEYYLNFSKAIEDLKHQLKKLLGKLINEGKSIAGYGAAAKATTLLSYFDIGKEAMSFIADKNKFKHGKYMGHTHLPIVPPERITELQPDYVLILTWNFAEEIMQQLAEYKNKGGKFIIPIPEPRIV